MYIVQAVTPWASWGELLPGVSKAPRGGPRRQSALKFKTGHAHTDHPAVTDQQFQLPHTGTPS